MRDLTYDVRDPWRAARLGASGKKIWLAFKGIAGGYLVFLAFGYAANLMAGNSPSTVWRLYRLFPHSPIPYGGPLHEGIWTAGVVVALMIVLVASAGVAKITYRELKGDDFYGRSDAWQYALEHGRSVVGAPIVLAAGLAGIILLLLIVGWLSRIPAVGAILVGILALPAFVAALLGIFLVLSLALSFLVTPAVVGTTGEDAIEGSIQSMSLLWAVPWRTAGYTVVAAASTLLGTWLLAVISFSAIVLIGNAFHATLGPAFDPFVNGVAAYLPTGVPLLAEPTSWLWHDALRSLLPAISTDIEGPVGAWWIASLLGGLTLLCIIALVHAYAISSMISGTTAGYIVLRRLKDGEDLLDWTDEVDELEERLAVESGVGEPPENQPTTDSDPGSNHGTEGGQSGE
jgi:hypothetical protein